MTQRRETTTSGHELGDPCRDKALHFARFEGQASHAASHVTTTPEQYVDDEVVFRQLTCQGCFTAVYTGVVPATHVDHVLEIDRYATV